MLEEAPPRRPHVQPNSCGFCVRLQWGVDRGAELLAAQVQQQVEQKLQEDPAGERGGERSGQTAAGAAAAPDGGELLAASAQPSAGVDVQVLESVLRQTERCSCIHEKVRRTSGDVWEFSGLIMCGPLQAADQLTEECQQLGAEQRDHKQQIKKLQSERARVQTDLQVLRSESTAEPYLHPPTKHFPNPLNLQKFTD